MLKIYYILFVAFLLFRVTCAQQKVEVVVSTGAFGILDSKKVLMSSFDLLMEDNRRLINPKLGFMFTSGNSIYSSFGFYIKQNLIYGLSVSFSFAPGLFYNFKEDILGHFLEFNSGFEIAYALPDKNLVSISFHHLSNGGLAKYNPGAEFLIISYIIPMKK